MATNSNAKLHEQCRKHCEKYDRNKCVKLEDSVIEAGDFVISKSEIPLINDSNLVQDTILENIKTEDAANSESYIFQLEKIETVKVDMCVKNENELISQNDPLSDDPKTHVKLETKEELNPENNPSHLTSKKSNNKVAFCKDCNKTFNYNYYKFHARSHAGNTSLKCEICGKGFVLQHCLNSHRASHSDNRPYRCDSCGKRFKTSNGLQKHQYVHSDDKPFHCSQCNKSFKRRNSLKGHQRKHNTNKQYICEICGKGYTDLTGLKYHKGSHEVEKKFACSQCGKLFQGKVRLQQHVTHIHSVKKVHICSYCGKTFKGKSGMMNHIHKHTG
ncbi:zinc finger protein, partial [Oryctes borbonicus]